MDGLMRELYGQSVAPVAPISGQVIFRDAGSADHLLPGEDKKLMIVIGIVAVPNDTKFKGEHQYQLVGTDGDGVSQIEIHKRSEIDQREVTEGNSLSGITRAPIWRV